MHSCAPDRDGGGAIMDTHPAYRVAAHQVHQHFALLNVAAFFKQRGVPWIRRLTGAAVQWFPLPTPRQ